MLIKASFDAEQRLYFEIVSNCHKKLAFALVSVICSNGSHGCFKSAGRFGSFTLLVIPTGDLFVEQADTVRFMAIAININARL